MSYFENNKFCDSIFFDFLIKGSFFKSVVQIINIKIINIKILDYLVIFYLIVCL